MNEPAKRQHVILCEGFDDRAFWAQWLIRMQCRDLEKNCKDPWRRTVGRGQYGFESPAGVFVRILPYGGLEQLATWLTNVAEDHRTRPVFHLIVNLDADDTPDAPSTSADDRVHGVVRALDPEARPDEHGAYHVRGMRIAPVIWRCDDPAGTAGVPDKQTLERIVAAAIAEAHDGRGQAVAGWLAADPCAEDTGHKHHALSYLAKWYAAHGCEDFYRQVWRDDRVAAGLERRLRQSGAWAHVDALCVASPADPV